MKAYLTDKVRQLRPGEGIVFDRETLGEIPPYEHNGVTFTAADQILAAIMGSAYEYRYSENPRTGAVLFQRRAKPLCDGRRAHVDPDRRGHFSLGIDGIYTPKSD